MIDLMKINPKHLREHESKRQALIRFFLALSILIIYTIYLVVRFGTAGFALGVITWSAFVMGTPLPDGGLILDFPIRLLTNIRMVYSEIIVWLVAIFTNLYFVFHEPQIYQKTAISHAFYLILIHPWPNWIIIAISGIGTFMGLYFADELLDIIFMKDRKKYLRFRLFYRIILVVFLILIFYFVYRYFLGLFGLKI